MNSHTPETGTAPPAAVPVSGGKRWRWLLFAVVALLLAGGGAGAWWWWRPVPPAPPTPPALGDIEDAEIRKALETARQQVLDKPEAALAWGNLGMALMAHGFEAEADPCFAEAARLDAADARWSYARGLLALRRDADHALAFLRQAAADPQPEYRSFFRLRLAEALLERQEWDEAEKLFREEERRDSNNARAILGLGLVAAGRNDEQAVALLSQPAVRDGKFTRKKAMAQRAVLALAHDDSKTAADCAKATAALPDDLPWPDPFLVEVNRLQVGRRNRDRKIRQLEQQGQYEEAAEAYLQQIQNDKTARACVGAGINLAHLGKYDQALRWLREGVRLDPNSNHAHYCLAVTQFARAEEEWQRSPGSSQAREWFHEAVKHAQRAAELKPDNAPAYLLWGMSLKYLEKPSEAVAPLRKGVACQPTDIELQTALGEVLLETKQYEEAETCLENARQLDPKDARVLQALERLHKKKD